MLIPFPSAGDPSLDEEFGLRSRRQPPGEEGDWERCQCDCHRMSGVMHCVPCCDAGWKATFRLLAKRYQAAVEAAARENMKAPAYKPAHGGYPAAAGSRA